jgi:hypothetical protein
MLPITPELRKRLARLILDGYMVKRSPDFSCCLLTDKGMQVLLACAESPIRADRLTKPSLDFERAWAAIDQTRQLRE